MTKRKNRHGWREKKKNQSKNFASCAHKKQNGTATKKKKNQIINRALKIESPSASSRVCKKRYSPQRLGN